MRFIILLLASSFFLSSVQPLFKQIQTSNIFSSQMESCCKKEKQEKKSNQSKDCCNNGVCNPLNKCNCCLYIIQLVDSNFKFTSFKRDLFPTLETKFLSSYITETFHPPNLV